MITHIMSFSIYVLDLERALAFYVERLGFRVHTDIFIGPGVRWASVCPPGEGAHQLMLIPVEEGVLFDAAQVRLMQDLIGRHFFSYGVFKCGNLQATSAVLRSKGVRFLTDPGAGFLGQYEASFLDDSGNWFRLTEDGDAV